MCGAPEPNRGLQKISDLLNMELQVGSESCTLDFNCDFSPKQMWQWFFCDWSLAANSFSIAGWFAAIVVTVVDSLAKIICDPWEAYA